jgi:tyrosyl-tRNA synthetase
VLTTPILEGLDGVQKMSKSLGNAIGVHEPPVEMFGKVMSISDAMMWRYYELLTDVSTAEISRMQTQCAAGEKHPMDLKKALARSIVTDFHSADASASAEEDWVKQHQKGQTPDSVESVDIPRSEVVRSQSGDDLAVHVDKLVSRAGLAASRTEAARKLNEGAVKIDGEPVSSPIKILKTLTFVLQVGRKMKRVNLS